MKVLTKVQANIIDDGGCWIWQKATQGPSKAPQMRCPITGTPSPVRRLLMRELHSLVDPKKMVITTCRTPKCVNPEHLAAVTKKTIARTASAEGKMSGPMRSKRMRVMAHKLPNTKLNEQKAGEIRASDEPTKVLSERYGISTSLVNKIRAGRAWVPEATRTSPWAGLLNRSNK